jgi:glycerol kinase
VAYLAGLATGVWPGLESIAAQRRVERRFEPSMPASRRAELLEGWKRAVAATLAFAQR